MQGSPYYHLSLKAARIAGDLILQGFQNLVQVEVTTKSRNNFVTAVDHASEEAIIKILSQAYPQHIFWGEEGGPRDAQGNAVTEDAAREADFLWLIDPLDGTTNFIHGLPHCAVSIALLKGGKLQDALVFNPFRNEVFNASRGRGAFVDQKRMRVSSCLNLDSALLSSGIIAPQPHDFEQGFMRMQELSRKCAGMRQTGSAVLNFAYVASGRLDGFFERYLKPWDIAAGALLVLEAGGYVRNYQGQSDYLYGSDVIAAPPKVFAPLVQELQALDR